MKLLLLPGNSSLTKSWIHEVGRALQGLFSECLVHEYEHWISGSEHIDYEAELKRLSALSPAGQEPSTIFAKSAGVVLALLAAERKIIPADRGILVGTPVKMAASSGIDLDALTRKFP